jgi:hypothetical protein
MVSAMETWKSSVSYLKSKKHYKNPHSLFEGLIFKIHYLYLIVVGCRQFCPVCLCSFCFASLRLSVLLLLVGAQLWSSGLACSICGSSMLYSCSHFVFLCFSSACCASSVLLEFSVSVVSVLIRSFGFVFDL